MKITIAFALLVTLALLTLRAQQQPAYQQLKLEAESYYAEGSYQRAHEVYTKADGLLTLPPIDSRWVKFRLGDTLWRAQAATEAPDSTKFDQARKGLEALLVRDIKRDEDRDHVWAETQESLGDFFWTRRNNQNWNAAWPFYNAALEWWAGERDLDAARSRYLKIVWTAAQPPHVEMSYYYGSHGNYLPLQILENTLKISRTVEYRARAHYLLAMTLRTQGGDDMEQRARISEEFEAALKTGKQTSWYDDALYHYAESLTTHGRIVALETGGWRNEPDYVKALELFRRIIKEFRKGETAYYDQAAQQIQNITTPALSLSVANIFLPDSEMQFFLNWRNTSVVDLALYRVNLTTDVQFSKREESSGNWLQAINLAAREKVRSWSKPTEGSKQYTPGQEIIRVPGKLSAGAYVIEARSGRITARDLILVTDTALLLKTSKGKALAYFCHALTGAPVARASVRLWEKFYNGVDWNWRAMIRETNADGIAAFDLSSEASGVELYAAAAATTRAGERQAFSLGYAHHQRQAEQAWRIYAFTDRPAYRPGESVQWKFIARQLKDGVYTTPANQTVEYEIHDPRGTKVKEGKAALNAFGSAWGGLELGEAMPLGEYRINFYDENRRSTIGGATLFRLEEYKLPEFKVSVQTPEENGRKKAFRLGEKVSVEIAADHYFGGAVANAAVEVVVYQNPFYQTYRPQREYAWFYEEQNARHRSYGGQGSIIKRETLRTDAQGKARLEFETPRGAGQDYEYRVEARVTDSSRREITTTGSVRVTRQRYYVYPQPEHNLYRPQDKVKVNLKAIDANDQPIEAAGQVKITRDYWYEIWIDPQGREIKGDELKTMRGGGGRGRVFPPSDERGWRLKFRGYQHDDVLTQTIKTNALGEAEVTFSPEREGYYRIAWSSVDRAANAFIKAETLVWVATNATSDLGYRHGGLQIIVDKDTFQAGQDAPVMLTAPTSDAYVLLSVEGEEIYSYQLVHLTGTVKLIQLPIEEKHVPNVFLSAAMVADHQIHADTKEVIVPPIKNFMQVEVKTDRKQYQPREEGTLTVTTRDHAGHAVAAEVALSLVDESVFYIQQDTSGDPRQFYYGSKRPQLTQTQSTFQQKAYARLIEGDDKKLIDDKSVRQRNEDQEAADARGRRDNYSAEYGQSVGVVDDREGNLIYKEQIEELAINGRNLSSLQYLSRGASAGKMKAEGPPSASPVGANPVNAQGPAVQVRSDFRSTVLWRPDVVTDQSGQATVKIKYPDSLTGWQATARVASAGNQFGIGSATTRTKQPLIVRLQAPRFFLVGDEVTVSGVINNNTERALTVTPMLEAEGIRVVTGTKEPLPLTIEPGGEIRADWVVAVEKPGIAKLKVTARGDGEHADAMEKSYIVYEHGVEKFVSKSGKMRGDEVTVTLNIPRERKAESTELTVQVAPSMAVTMLDALPYLIDYPYGCTEQTMSRFLPAAMTAKTLRDLGLRPEDAMRKLFGGIEQATVNATQPQGKRDLTELDAIVKRGLERLYDFQHADGGWGWWKDGESDHYMTAYVVWGLSLASEAEIQIREDARARGAQFLVKEIVEKETAYDEQAWMLHALAVHHAAAKTSEVGKFERQAFDNLWTHRDKLNAYTRALLALAAHHYGLREQALVLVRNLENGARVDASPDVSVIQPGTPALKTESVISTAHWGEGNGVWWRWSEGGVESTAFAFRALLAIDPRNKLIEPVTNWLVKNRRGAQWSNTRDTAITVLALNDYLRTSKELATDVEYELSVNGTSVVTKKIAPAEAINAPSRFKINQALLRDGANEIRLRRREGDGALYFAAEARFFSLEEPVTASGNEIFVRREYYKLVGRPTLLKGYVYDRLPLRDGESVRSGERVEALITIEAKNNYEYLLFEDLKPAGLEAVQLRSGEPLYAVELKAEVVESKLKDEISSPSLHSTINTTGRTRYIYQELRDRKVALFIDKLPQGVWQIRYDLRAETPGKFHALPVLGHAMYVPEIRTNGAETRITVVDAAEREISRK